MTTDTYRCQALMWDGKAFEGTQCPRIAEADSELCKPCRLAKERRDKARKDGE